MVGLRAVQLVGQRPYSGSLAWSILLGTGLPKKAVPVCLPQTSQPRSAPAPSEERTSNHLRCVQPHQTKLSVQMLFRNGWIFLKELREASRWVSGSTTTL